MNTAEATEFLTSMAHFREYSAAGVDCHLSDIEAAKFQELAEKINPNPVGFTWNDWRGCLPCANAMVKFVFANEAKLAAKTVKKEA